MIIVMKKQCFNCKKLKDHTDFYRNKSAKDGFHSWCKSCERPYFLRPEVKNRRNERMVIYGMRPEVKRRKKQYGRKYQRERYQNSSKHRLAVRMKNFIGKCIGLNKAGRKWQRLVGYTADDLKRHLEKQFQSGMTWDNYGDWHIDHIIPVSAFDFTKPEDIDFKQCWALENLQPLWAKENLRKSNKILGSLICESRLTG